MNANLSCLTKLGFDLDTTVLLAQAAELAYEPNATIISNWARLQGFEMPNAFDRGNIQGFWATAGQVALLVFRGTSNIGQWVRDARLLPVQHPWGHVHLGFRDGLAQVDQPLRDFAQAAEQAEYLWIAGHSLGGALAVMAAAWFTERGRSPTIYTFGQPRVGLGDFRDRCNAALPGRMWRFVNQSDVVPRLPPGVLYRHCGVVKRIVRPGQLESRSLDADNRVVFADTDEPPLTDEEYSSLLKYLTADPQAATLEAANLEGRSAPFRDHSMLEYLRLLTEIRDRQLAP